MSSTLIIAIVTIAGTFGFMYFQRSKLNKQYANMRAGELAQRLGMQVTEGNPEHNLATQSVQPGVQNVGSAKGFLRQMAATQVGGTLGEFKLHLQGSPYGVRAEVVLFCRQDLATGLTQNTTTTWYDLRLLVYARSALVPFELRLKREMTGLETNRSSDTQAMPAQRFGIPILDDRYTIETFDGSLPSRIASALAALSPHLMYVRVVGTHERVSFVMTPASVMCSAPSFEQLLHVLVSTAAILEGRAAPARMLG